MTPGRAGLAAAIWATTVTTVYAAPPPTTSAEVKAWVARNLTGVGRAPILGFNTLGVTFAAPRAPTSRADGVIESEIRQEFFEPVELEGEVMRSTTGRWALDCARQRYAVLRMTLYARNNLAGQLSERETEPPVWSPRDTISEPALDALCRAVKAKQQ